MKKLLILLSLVLATNAWAEYFYVDCELATHKRKGTPLTQFKDVCSEDLKSECYYSEIQLIIDFQTYHPRRNYWSLKGYEDVQVMVRGKKEVTSLTDWSGTSWDSWGEYELPEEKYEFKALGSFFLMEYMDSEGFKLTQNGWESTYICSYVSDKQGKENIKNLKIPE